LAEKLQNIESQKHQRTETLKNKKARTNTSSVVLSNNNSQQQSSTSSDLKIASSIANNSMVELKNEIEEKNDEILKLKELLRSRDKQDLEKQIVLDKLNDDLKEAKNKLIELEKFLRKLKLI
jgi:hypothetical protein